MRISAFILFILAVFCALAQTPDFAKNTLPDSVRVGYVTCSAGSEVYELDGHAALHISGRISDMPVDLAINYGVFDFNSPNFLYRFVKGETDYMVVASPWPIFLDSYIEQGRRVVERNVPLDSAQTTRLLTLLTENLKPQNRIYRYNYVKDNCATRPLRLIELAIGDSIVMPSKSEKTATFRQIMTADHANYPWYQFGIDLALGSGIDQPISERDKSFAPVVLDKLLDSATVAGRPLVDSVTVLNEGTDVTLPPTPWYLTPVFVGWIVFVIALAITIRDIKRRKVSRWFDTLYYTIAAIAGCVLTFLIFVSLHEATSPNWLYLWLNPLCAIVPIFIWLKKCKKVVFSYQIINFALLLIMVCTWGMHSQVANAAFYPLVLTDFLRAANYIVINKIN